MSWTDKIRRFQVDREGKESEQRRQDERALDEASRAYDSLLVRYDSMIRSRLHEIGEVYFRDNKVGRLSFLDGVWVDRIQTRGEKGRRSTTWGCARRSDKKRKLNNRSVGDGWDNMGVPRERYFSIADGEFTIRLVLDRPWEGTRANYPPYSVMFEYTVENTVVKVSPESFSDEWLRECLFRQLQSKPGYHDFSV